MVHAAARYGQPHIVKALIEELGADPLSKKDVSLEQSALQI